MKSCWRNMALIGLLALWLAPLAMAAPAKGFFGVWRGTVLEVAPPGQEPARYSVTIEVLPGRVLVDYPGLGCGGKLHPLRRRGDWVGFRDALDYGLERCEANGRTELYLLGQDRVGYRWFDARGRLRAEGRLQRQRQLLVLNTVERP